MVENLFFILGIANNLYLTLIFLVRKYFPMSILQRVGSFYFLLAIPAVYDIWLVGWEHKTIKFRIFLGIFLVFLALEGLYDFILKINFRVNWRLLTPYLCLYYMMNYGFIVMVWKFSVTKGCIILGLFMIQLIINLCTHKNTGKLKL
jgi:hypothetical protein